jgi:hypothetical protein
MSQQKQPVRILFCVPSFRGTIMTHTMVCIAKTMVLLTELGIYCDILNVDSAEIVTVRNNMANYALNRTEITHLLFIDDDMTFEADAIIDLMRADKPIIGCICPKREISLERFHAAVKAGATLQEATTEALSFVTRHIPMSQLEIREGLCRVAGIGMGVTLIKMSVFRALVEKNAVIAHAPRDGVTADNLGNTVVHGFFDQVFEPEIGANLSEDLSFCERWVKQCDGEVWALVTRQIGHIGSYIYTGTYMDRLRTGKI